MSAARNAYLPGGGRENAACFSYTLRKLAATPGIWVRYTPELAFVRVRTSKDGMRDSVYTLVHNKAHTNVAFMFFEEDRRDETNDTMTVVPGFLGSYPNFFFDVKLADVDGFVSGLKAVDDASAFTALVERYGVRRSSPAFWEAYDWFSVQYGKTDVVNGSLFDLNRYDDD